MASHLFIDVFNNTVRAKNMNQFEVRKALYKKLRERNHDPMIINYAIGLMSALTPKEVKKILDSLESDTWSVIDY